MKHIFIINANLSNMYDAEKIRMQLAKRKDFEYLVFNTEYAGHEQALTEQMIDLFKDEKIRLYCCGGMGTFYHMINGIKDLDKTEIALLPCGISCDLLKVFGQNRRFFHSLDNLIEGEVLPLDIIETGNFRAVNAIAAGAGVRGSQKIEKIRNSSKLWEPLAYSGSGIASVLFDRTDDYEVEIDGKIYKDRYKQIYIGNGCCWGGKYYPFPDTKPNDGVLNFVLLHDIKTKVLLHSLKCYQMGDIEYMSQYADYLTGKSFTIRSLTGKKTVYNCDGENESENVLTGSVLKQKLKFIVPAGIKL